MTEPAGAQKRSRPFLFSPRDVTRGELFNRVPNGPREGFSKKESAVKPKTKYSAAKPKTEYSVVKPKSRYRSRSDRGLLSHEKIAGAIVPTGDKAAIAGIPVQMMKEIGGSAFEEVLEFARSRSKGAKNWIDLHNALFGIGGKCSELFPTEAERTAFGSSEQFREITKMLDSLRARTGDDELGDLVANANGRILVRVPRSLHAALLAEAEAEGVTLNQLIVSKLSMQLGAAVRA